MRKISLLFLRDPGGKGSLGYSKEFYKGKLFILKSYFYQMDKEELALFLGMLSGDGYIGIRTKKKGYKNFSVEFCNTNLKIVKLFDNLFYSLFKTRGNFHSRIRNDRKEIFDFRKYSKDIFDYLSSLGFPIGVKKDRLRILPVITSGRRKEKEMFLIGLLITDGSIRKNNTILFHSGSKLLLEDLSKLIYGLFGVERRVKKYVQKGKYFSYQLSLNKEESQKIILLPPSHSGSATVLSLKG